MRLLSPRDLARALGVSESSLKRWVDAGKIVASRTEGGHRRIEFGEAMRFIREAGIRLAHPELLELSVTPESERETRLLDHLLDGDAPATLRWLTTRYLAGTSIAALADGPIRDAMYRIGDLWRHDPGGVYLEHRATDGCLNAVGQLRSLIEPPPPNSPIALGGAPSGDPYLLATQLAALVVSEAGLRPINLGPDTPPEAFERAIADCRPALVWLSITSALTPAGARAVHKWVSAVPATTQVVIGGQQAYTLGTVPKNALRMASLTELADHARSLRA